MAKTKPIKRSSINPKAGEIKGIWKKAQQKDISKGDIDYNGRGIKRGNVQCKTCRGGDEQRVWCSIRGATPVDGCRY